MSFVRRSVGVVVLLCVLAAISMAEDPREQAWTVLNGGLTNSNIEKRTKAVADLGLIPHDQKAVDAAITALKDDKPDVRAAAAQALGLDRHIGRSRLVDDTDLRISWRNIRHGDLRRRESRR